MFFLKIICLGDFKDSPVSRLLKVVFGSAGKVDCLSSYQIGIQGSILSFYQRADC